jgi:perosamine synthetase
VTTGEGGMVVMNDPALADRCRLLRNLGFGTRRRFVHEELGWNFRMTNLQAALGLAQLEQLEAHVARKRHIGRRYDALLAELHDVQRPLPGTDSAENIYWVYGLVAGESHGFDAEEAMRRLAAMGVGTRPFFWPMHEQPVFRRQGLFADVRCPVAERLGRRGFYLPSGLGLSDDEQTAVAAAVKQVFSAR